MPESAAPSAVIVLGGKQYRVSEGDRILVDRLGSEPGQEIAAERVLFASDGQAARWGEEAASVAITLRVLRHERGPKVMAFRYKPKKRVRVHRGSRAELTAVEVLSVGAQPEKARPKSRAKREPVPEADGGA